MPDIISIIYHLYPLVGTTEAMNWETTLKKLTDKTALNAASLWVDKPVNLKLVNNQINCVYRFESKGMGFYLRITHESIRPCSELLAALDFQQHLFLNNVPVCEPVLSKNNQLIEEITQDTINYFAHVCREVPGTMMHFDYSNKYAYLAWGQSLASLHRASQSYQTKNHVFKSWKDLWEETRQYAEKEDKPIHDLYHKIDIQFNQFTITPANFGLTHGDHRPGNVLYNGSTTHIIDFDEPVYHWFMADIARPFLETGNHKWRQKFEWYIEGYQSVLPITNAELQAINWFTQMKSLDIYLWCKNNWFEATAPGGKPREQWLTELKMTAITALSTIR